MNKLFFQSFCNFFNGQIEIESHNYTFTKCIVVLKMHTSYDQQESIFFLLAYQCIATLCFRDFKTNFIACLGKHLQVPEQVRIAKTRM